MGTLEKLIETAVKTRQTKLASAAKSRKSSGDKFVSSFSQLHESDVGVAERNFLQYADLVDKPSQEGDFFKFAEVYCAAQTSVDEERRVLFGQLVDQTLGNVHEMVRSRFYKKYIETLGEQDEKFKDENKYSRVDAENGRWRRLANRIVERWGRLDKVPTDVLKLWVASFKHLDTDAGKLDQIEYNERYEDYADVSSRHLSVPHVSHCDVLGVMSGDINLVGLEDMAFNIAKVKKLKRDGIVKHLDNLGTIPRAFRDDIKLVRGRVVYSQFDSGLYDLLFVKGNDAATICKSVDLLKNLTMGEVDTEVLMKQLDLLKQVAEKDVGFSLASTDFIEQVNRKDCRAVLSYLPSLVGIAGFDVSREDKLRYAEVAKEMVGDYFPGSPKDLDKKLSSAIGLMYSDKGMRKTILDLTCRVMRGVGRSARLDHLPKLYLDEAVGVIREAVLKDSAKASDFINLLLGFREK